MGIILRGDLNWVDQVNYVVQKAWRALHFAMRFLKKGDRKTKRLAYKSLVRPIHAYGAACCVLRRERQIIALNWVQTKFVQFTNRTKCSDWETLGQRRTIAQLCALFTAYSGERAWEATRDRLWRPSYLSRADHVRKIRDRKQRADIGKYSFVNRTIKNRN